MDAAALRLADLESRRICRFCLRSCATDDGKTEIGKDGKLVSRIGFALALEVAEKDGLPQRICGGCLWLIEKFYLFKDQCTRAEMLLKTFAESGMPLMQYFEPVDFAEFRWKRKWGNEIDVGIQVEDDTVIMMVEKKEKLETETEYEMIAPEMIKQEVEADDWTLGEEPDAIANLDQSDRVTMDEIARQLYEAEETTLNSFSAADHEIGESTPEGVRNMAELITEMDIGSPQLTQTQTINLDLYEDISNDTVEYAPLPETSSAAKEPKQPMEPISATEEMLLLMKDDEPQDSAKTSDESPQSPSDLIYEGLQTTPLCESDGLPSRFVNMEPGEIVSDDEYDTVVIISSDTEDNPPEEQPSGSAPIPTPVKQDPPKDEQYRCQKCDKFFPQSQLLEAHTKAYHMASPAKFVDVPGMAKMFTPAKNVPKQKMAIMIDNPVKKCPKCGTMVHKVSYLAHMRSHRSGGESEPVMNYERELTPAEELWD